WDPRDGGGGSLSSDPRVCDSCFASQRTAVTLTLDAGGPNGTGVANVEPTGGPPGGGLMYSLLESLLSPFHSKLFA
ncbi:hypothetical protein BHM03_00057171, partial [Ensete ventricosum]